MRVTEESMNEDNPKATSTEKLLKFDKFIADNCRGLIAEQDAFVK